METGQQSRAAFLELMVQPGGPRSSIPRDMLSSPASPHPPWALHVQFPQQEPQGAERTPYEGSEAHILTLAFEKESQKRLEAERLAQTTAEELSQVQSQLAEALREALPDHENLGAPKSPRGQQPGPGEVDGEPMSIQDTIEMEHGRLEQHKAHQDPGEDFISNFHIMSLAANLVGCVADPPKCKKCARCMFGDSQYPSRMASHTLGLCEQFNWDATPLQVDQPFTNGHCP